MLFSRISSSQPQTSLFISKWLDKIWNPLHSSSYGKLLLSYKYVAYIRHNDQNYNFYAFTTDVSNPLDTRKKSLKTLHFWCAQINSMPYPEKRCKMWETMDSPSIKGYPCANRNEMGKKSHEGKFSIDYVHGWCRDTLNGPDGWSNSNVMAAHVSTRSGVNREEVV